MILEFLTVRSSSLEGYQKEINQEIAGKKPEDFFNEDDYVSTMTLELNDVIDFVGGKVYFNDQCLDCVYCRTEDNVAVPNIIMKYEDFKKVFEHSKGIKIKSAKQLLEEL